MVLPGSTIQEGRWSEKKFPCGREKLLSPICPLKKSFPEGIKIDAAGNTLKLRPIFLFLSFAMLWKWSWATAKSLADRGVFRTLARPQPTLLREGNTAIEENVQPAVVKMFAICVWAGGFSLCLATNTWIKHFWKNLFVIWYSSGYFLLPQTSILPKARWSWKKKNAKIILKRWEEEEKKTTQYHFSSVIFSYK